ncbi:MAG: SH3 domain-containing protein [Candidatus Woesebacteria bacterium]|jgi:hypothetical protein
MKKLFIFLMLLGSTVFLTACNPLESKIKSGLQVITNDVPASLFLNGQYLEKTPFIDKNIKPGQYNLRIEPDDPNLTAHEIVINLRKGLLTVVTWKPGKSAETSGGVSYELEPIKSNKSEVSFVSIPDNVIIQFDDQEKQFSPLILSDLEPGHHEFEANLPSFETQKHTINLIKGHRLNISIKLAKMNDNLQNSDEQNKKRQASPSAELDEGSKDEGDTEETEVADQSNREAQISTSNADSQILSPKVKIKSTNFYQDGEEVLRVRDFPAATGKELGFAKVGTEYDYLDEEKNAWYKIDFNGEIGWVSSKYAQLID